MAYVSKEKTQQVRNDLKVKFPTKKGWKFSVRKDHSTIRVVLLKAPIDFISLIDSDRSLRHIKEKDAGGFGLIIRQIYDIILVDYFDKSDVMTDYFNVAFYYSFSIGSWDKEFVFVENAYTEQYAEEVRIANGVREEKERQEMEEFKAEQEKQAEAAKVAGEQREKDMEVLKSAKIYNVANAYDSTIQLKYIGCDCDTLEDFEEDGREEVYVTASMPLTNEQWVAFTRNMYWDVMKDFQGGYYNPIMDDVDVSNPNQLNEFYKNANKCVCLVWNTKTKQKIYVDTQGRGYCRYVFVDIPVEEVKIQKASYLKVV